MKKDSPDNGCPVGHEDCTLIAEVERLRQEVDRLKSLVSTDSLTGLPNLRHFQEALDKEMERTRRTGIATTLVMLDLDHFKEINDRFGHETGNRALEHVARCLRLTLRKTDIPCRYGGEEFGIILAQTDLPNSLVIAERLRESLEKSPLMIDHETLTITASIGVAPFTVDDNATPSVVIRTADQYLYQAKEEGRNRVCHPPLEALVERAGVTSDERSDILDLFGPADD